ncbi:MAG TPA: glycosyltransferase [Chloroflexota bacterium]|nr:glycosyltransferase [Chloroflexota bacterium]
MTRASVVIPTRGRPDLLRRCLAALLAQDLSEPFEIIVAADGPCDDTRAIVTSLLPPSHINVRYLALPDQRGPAAARNAGWRRASGQVIAFTDNDCVPRPNWLRAGLAAFRDDVQAVRGRVVVPVDQPPTDHQRSTQGLEHADFATANCFYRRAALEMLGGFDEAFTHAWREDSDLYFRLLDADGAVASAPDAVVVHPVSPAPFGISLVQQRKSLFNALLYKKHPQHYRRRIQSLPPLHYYAAVFAAVIALSARGHAGRVAAGVWLGITATFAAYRLRDTAHHLTHVIDMIVTSILIPPVCVYWRLRGAVRFRTWFL